MKKLLLRTVLILISLSLSAISFADEEWHIDPDGGQDYTTLQAAETAKHGDLTGRGVVQLTCYNDASDLGEVTIDGWTNNDSSNYVRIFVPLTERHDGTSGSSGAWIDIDSDVNGVTIKEEFTRVEGLRLNFDSGGDSQSGVDALSISDLIVDSNLGVMVAAGVNTSCIVIAAPLTTVTGITIRNNIVYFNGTAANGISVAVQSSPGAAASITGNIYNNTIDGAGSKGINMIEIQTVQPATVTLTLENNICTNSGAADFFATIVNGTITGNNNCSEDTTADTWDGSDSIISQSPGDLFETEGSDHNLKSGSNAIDAGKTISSFDNDALRLDAANWRPQGDAWDMGAIEKEVVAGQLIMIF